MIDDLPSFKAATIGRCGSRAREEYARAQEILAVDLPARDPAILNMLRVCEAALHMGNRLIHGERLGSLQSSRNVLMIVPTLPRGHTARPLPRLDAKRPEFGLPRRSVGAIKNPSPFGFQHLQSPCTPQQSHRKLVAICEQEQR